MNRLTLLIYAMLLSPLAASAGDYAPSAQTVPAPRGTPSAATDQAAATASAGPLVDSLAPPDCKQPSMATRMTRDTGTHDPHADFDAYQHCIKQYVDTQKLLQQKHFEAGSNAIKEFNDFIPKWNEYQNQPR